MYFARLNILKVGQIITGELQKRIARSILFSDINFISLIDLLLVHVHEGQEMRTLYPQSSLELETK